MPIEQPLLDILACPIDKQGLLYFEDEAVLYNPRLRRIYRMADDRLLMLADRAEPAADQEHERLLKRARHGDAIGTAGLDAGSACRLARVLNGPNGVVMRPCPTQGDTTSGDQYHTSSSHYPR